MASRNITWGEDKPLTILSKKDDAGGFFLATLHEPKKDLDDRTWFNEVDRIWSHYGEAQIVDIYNSVKPFGRSQVGNGQILVGKSKGGDFIFTPYMPNANGVHDFGFYKRTDTTYSKKVVPSDLFSPKDLVSLARKALSYEALQRVPFVAHIGATELSRKEIESSDSAKGMGGQHTVLMDRASELKARVAIANASLSDDATLMDKEAANQRTREIRALSNEVSALNASLAEQRVAANMADSVLTTMRMLHPDPRLWKGCTPLTGDGMLGPCRIGQGDDTIDLGGVTPQQATKALGHLHIPLSAIPPHLREFDAAVGEMVHHALFHAHAGKSTTQGADGVIYDTMAKQPTIMALADLEGIVTRKDSAGNLEIPHSVVVNRLREVMRCCEGAVGLRSLLLDLTGKRGAPEYHIGEFASSRSEMDERISGGSSSIGDAVSPRNWDKQIPRLLAILEQESPTIHKAMMEAARTAGMDIKVLQAGQDFDILNRFRDVSERKDGVGLDEFVLEEGAPLHLKPYRPRIEMAVEALNDLALLDAAARLEHAAAGKLATLSDADAIERDAFRTFEERVADIRRREAQTPNGARDTLSDLNKERGDVRRMKEDALARATQKRSTVNKDELDILLNRADVARSEVKQADPLATVVEFMRVPNVMSGDAADVLSTMASEITLSLSAKNKNNDRPDPTIQVIGNKPALTNRPRNEEKAGALAEIIITRILGHLNDGNSAPSWLTGGKANVTFDPAKISPAAAAEVLGKSVAKTLNTHNDVSLNVSELKMATYIKELMESGSAISGQELSDFLSYECPSAARMLGANLSGPVPAWIDALAVEISDKSTEFARSQNVAICQLRDDLKTWLHVDRNELNGDSRDRYVGKTRDEIVRYVNVARGNPVSAGHANGAEILDSKTTTHGLEQALRDLANCIPQVPKLDKRDGKLLCVPLIQPSTAVAIDLIGRLESERERRFDESEKSLDPALEQSATRSLINVLNDLTDRIRDREGIRSTSDIVRESEKRLIEEYKRARTQEQSEKTKMVAQDMIR